MQIVINISEKIYESVMDGTYCGTLYQELKKGTPLPKGHGRLIDANRLRSMYSINRANFNTVVGIQKWIDDAPTIIEADEVESEDADERG